jgi:hypothetical protein
MISTSLRWALPMVLAAHAAGQTYLFGVRANGDLIRINPQTGAGALVGSSGVPCTGGEGFSTSVLNARYSYILTAGGDAAHSDQIIAIDHWSGAGSVYVAMTGRPAGYTVGAMTTGYALLRPDDAAGVDLFASLNLYSGALTVIGPTGRSGLEAFAESPSGVLYALSTAGGGTLYTIDPSSGATTPIGAGGFGDDDHALAFLPDGTLLACGANLLSVNPTTGATTPIGPTGFTNIRGLTVLTLCYPNCDQSPGAFPPLNVQDFSCFLVKFASGNPYANCDGSSTPPVLNVADFTCFITKYAAGCSVP